MGGVMEIRGYKYSPQTGLVYRGDLKHGTGRSPIGPVRTKNSGYYNVKFKSGESLYFARLHRVAYYLMTGTWLPSKTPIDHANGNPLDNRWCNLRVCKHAQNTQNSRARSNKAVPWKGVSTERSNKFRARVTRPGKTIFLGHFSAADDAAMAYNEAAYKYFGEFALLNVHPLNYDDSLMKEYGE